MINRSKIKEVEDFYQYNEEKNMSNFGTLSWQDLIKGLIIAVLSAVLTYLYEVVNGGMFSWQALAIVSAIAFCSYMIKNLGTTKDGLFLGIV